MSPRTPKPVDPVKKLTRLRATLKAKVTNQFAMMSEDESDTNVKNCSKIIENLLVDVQKIDAEICDLLSEDCSDDDIPDEVSEELGKQSSYITSVRNKLSYHANTSPVSDTSVPSTPVSSSDCKLKLPELKCEHFSGEGSTHLEFHSFLTSFNNIVGLRKDITASTKFTYLKSFLKGYASKLVQHLQVTEQNFSIAIDLLKTEFLNVEALVDDLFRKILDLKPVYDPSFLKTKVFLGEIRCLISDLNLYDFDFLHERAGNKLMSHIIFNKLPMPFKQELVRKLNNNFPSIKDILDNYVDVIRTLNLKPVKTNPVEFEKPKSYSSINRSGVVTKEFSPSTRRAIDVPKFCKFCATTGHNMIGCNRYTSYDSRKKRCRELGLCFRCSSQRHISSECNKPLDFECTKCNSRNHITALCDKSCPNIVNNFCVNSNDSGRTFLLPFVKLEISAGKSKTSVRCLIDTGSQRSYLSAGVMKRLDFALKNKTDLVVNTFIDNDKRSFYETSVTLNLDRRKFSVPFLINDDFDLRLEIEGLKQCHSNLSAQYNLNEIVDSDTVTMEGLLGVDVLQCFSKFNLVSCLGGSAFELPSCIIPFGNVDGFLTDKQLKRKYRESNHDSDIDNSIVNFVLSPCKTSFDPIGSVTRDNQIEDGLDQMFSLESIGISKDVTDYDQEKINNFESSIKFDGEKYNVSLPWNESIKDVPNNFAIAKSVLRKVVNKLHSDGRYNEYAAILQKQQDEGILEEVNIDSVQVEDHVFVPHRPVIKEDSLTTKLRIVLNCSMKIRDSPSLNEASYPGIDLVNNLFELLLRVRADDFLVQSDIRSAFLMIGLTNIADRNKFSILWFNENNELKVYRYKTIVFGLTSSPFILQAVIRHHLSKYEDDECSRTIKNGLYVDNLFYTGNEPSALLHMFKDTHNRMAQGGFNLRSWSSNSPELTEAFENEGLESPSVENCEKLLGYRYYPAEDKVRVSNFDHTDLETKTKRSILAYISRIFDPLGFVTPLLVGAKLLMKELWTLKLDWDEPVPDTILQTWSKVKSSIDQIPNLAFYRKAYSGDISLLIFADSSKKAYGFVCYSKSVSTNSCRFLFSKNKIAPNDKLSLPTLELMSVYLSIKCLPTILSSIKVPVTSVTIAVDSQVALSWILSCNVKSKNVMAKNRVKDITKLRSDIKDAHDIDVKFKYVSTEENPADVLTRDISFREFEVKLNFWLNGPGFANTDPSEWPAERLGCLSQENKILTLSTHSRQIESIIPVDKFSNLDKLFRVTALVLKFIGLVRKKPKTELQYRSDAKSYWIRYEQTKFFADEIKFLQKPTKTVPNLINNLNLYIDEENLVRSRGRLGHAHKHDVSVKNPLILPRQSFLTSLFIEDFHRQCKHLGVSATLVRLRNSGYWVPKGRVAVKTVLAKCIICQKINSYAFRYPVSNDYIANKVNFVRAYEHTGVDFTGHVFVKFDSKLSKMYILVFTCLNTRALHIELLPDLTCENFLLSFIRFANRYGQPSIVYSDNASTFLQAMGILKKSSTDDIFSEYLVKNEVKHIRIPLYAAWIGAAWERMIKTLKSCLNKTLGRKHVPYFQLITLLTDIQESINSRPLTYVESDVNFHALTPNSFLKPAAGCKLTLEAEAGSEIVSPSRNDLVRALEYREELLQTAKTRWEDDYLLSLREAGRERYQEEWLNRVEVGAVVLISAPNKTRAHWQLGRILELLPGADNIVRTVRVLRPDRSEGVFPIKHLYPLELEVLPIYVGNQTSNEQVCVSRPKRAAALKCADRLNTGN